MAERHRSNGGMVGQPEDDEGANDDSGQSHCFHLSSLVLGQLTAVLLRVVWWAIAIVSWLFHCGRMLRQTDFDVDGAVVTSCDSHDTGVDDNQESRQQRV